MELEEERKRLYKELRESQFKMASMYDELMKEVEPAVDQLKLDINAALDKYRDIDANIEAIPENLDEALGMPT